MSADIKLFDHRGNVITARQTSPSGLSVFAALVALCAAGYVGFERLSREDKPRVVAIDSADLKFDDWQAEPFETDWKYGHNILDKALFLWKESTGIEIPKPKIFVGTCFSDVAVACANSDLSRITFTAHWNRRKEQDPSLLTIMLHEIGHLYGVPHIEGDDLMNDSLKSSVQAPTPAAISLAITHHSRGAK